MLGMGWLYAGDGSGAIGAFDIRVSSALPLAIPGRRFAAPGMPSRNHLSESARYRLGRAADGDGAQSKSRLGRNAMRRRRHQFRATRSMRAAAPLNAGVCDALSISTPTRRFADCSG